MLIFKRTFQPLGKVEPNLQLYYLEKVICFGTTFLKGCFGSTFSKGGKIYSL